MRYLLLQNFGSLKSKYWLLPALMAIGAIVVSFAIVAVDRQLGIEWIERLPLLYVNEPAGTRALLSTIAGSMITVAGVTFSITMAALATTAATFGPRLISNFMQDRGNQVALSTFLFCLLVLRTVQTGEDAAAFVPHLAVVVALMLALASLGRSFHSQVGEMFPRALGRPASTSDGSDDVKMREWIGRKAADVRAGADGYLQYVDTAGLMKQAKERDFLVEFANRPGDFVGRGRVIARVGFRGDAAEEALERVQGSIVIGGFQSTHQNVLYIVNRPVEVAGRALLPGMNDIFTATNAMDWLGGGLANLAGRSIPEDLRRDDESRVRIRVRSRTLEEIAGAIFDHLRLHAAADRNAVVHLIRVLATVGTDTMTLQRRVLFLTHAKALRRAALQAIDQPRDVELIEAVYGDTVASLSAPRIGA